MADHDSLAYQLHQSTLTREAKLVAAENENDDLRGEVDRLQAENDALRELVRRSYTQAWETPLTVEQDELLDRVLLGKADR